MAPNVEVLIAARALQGVGGALLTPGSLALISAGLGGIAAGGFPRVVTWRLRGGWTLRGPR